MNGDLGDAVASMSQSRNRLENRRGENNEVPRGMWEIVETSTREVGVGKAKRRRSKKRSRKKKRRKEEEEEAEKGKNNGGKESSRGMGDIRWKRGSGKVRSRVQKVGTREIP